MSGIRRSYPRGLGMGSCVKGRDRWRSRRRAKANPYPLRSGRMITRAPAGEWRRGRKMRYAVIVCAVGGLLLPGIASSLGLGNVQVDSSLNAPLSASIPLLGAPRDGVDQVHAGLGGEADFRAVGLDRPYWLTGLRFRVVSLPTGGNEIRLTTREPVHEPAVSFVVEVTWPGGRLFRDYTILLDPQGYPRIQAARAEVPKAAMPTPPNERKGRVGKQGVPGTYGPVKSGETAWNIAAKIRPDASTSVKQTMMALLRKNPSAFIRGNVNLLKAGVTLEVPSREDVNAPAAREARTAVHHPVRVSRQEEKAAARPPASASRLEIVGAGDRGPDGDDYWRLQEQILSLRAERDYYRRDTETVSRENARLEGRVTELEQNVSEMRERLAEQQAQYSRLAQQVAKITAARGPGGASEGSSGSAAMAKGEGVAQVADVGMTISSSSLASADNSSSGRHLWILLAFGVTVLGLGAVGFWALRRKRAGARVPGMSPRVGSDWSPQPSDDELESGLAAIDLALSRRQFAQAETLLKDLADQFPGHAQVLAKRLEIFAQATGSGGNF